MESLRTNYFKQMEEGFLHYFDLQTLACEHVEELVDYYLDGELPAILLPRFETHVTGCEECQLLISDLKRILQIAKTMDEGTLPQGVRERLRRRLNDELGEEFLKKSRTYIVK